jgi:hypothetical protein
VRIPFLSSSPSATPRPTLGAYAENRALSADQLRNDPQAVQQAATRLLECKGFTSPSQRQRLETAWEINQALRTPTWESYTPRFSPSLLPESENVFSRLGNVFFEKELFTPESIEGSELKLTVDERKYLESNFETGAPGRVLAATFINSPHRSEGDFSRAYGDRAWKGFLRAHTFLASIPKGQLLEWLNYDLVVEVNRLAHVPDEGVQARALRTIAMIGRGGQWDVPGEIRTGPSYARPACYRPEEIENLAEAGVRVIPITSGPDGTVRAMLQWPPAERLPRQIAEEIFKLHSALREPNADRGAAAADFQRRFVALHAFGDSNGRTARLLMNRILAEYDLPPAIFADQDRDISVSAEDWRTEVKLGMARTKKFLRAQVGAENRYLAQSGISVVSLPHKQITVQGHPFQLGRDGMLYDVTGRPHLVSNKELVPLSQLDHYLLSRRLTQLGARRGVLQLRELVLETRRFHRNACLGAEAAEGFEVRSDARARGADMRYGLNPEPEIASVLTALAESVGSLTAGELFEAKSAHGTELSSTVSRYTQIDLELWHLEKGLREGGEEALAGRVHAQREGLFEKARQRLDGLDTVHRYEHLMLNGSPLRYASLAAAIAFDGDDQVKLWRGDYAFAKVIGMAPDNDPRTPDALAVASNRASMGQVVNLYDDLVRLEGTARGGQYLCATSDLALLTRMFAENTQSSEVNAGKLATWLVGDRKVELPGVTAEVKGEEGKIAVSSSRRAFQITMDKAAALPGVYAFGGSYEAEQEIHGLQSLRPWRVGSSFSKDELRERMDGEEPEPDVFPVFSGPLPLPQP